MEAICSSPSVARLHLSLSYAPAKTAAYSPSAMPLHFHGQRQQNLCASPEAHLSSAHSSFSSSHRSSFHSSAPAQRSRSTRSQTRPALRAEAEDGQQYDYDLFTIGAGSGGVRASRFASQYGAKVAVCELPFSTKASDDKGGVGGTCVLRGCVPKKLLVYGSHFADYFEDARGFGWSFPGGEPEVDWSHLIEKKNKELDRLNNAYKTTLKNAKVDLIEGKGKVIDRHTVDVDGKRFKVKNILIATGGRIFVPPIPGAEHVITSDDALDLTSVPSKIAIVGGGYIALEFAGIFNSAGAEVDIFVRGDKLLRGFDDEVREFLAEQLQAQGIRIHFGAKPVEIHKHGEGQLSLKTEEGDTWEGSHVMFATGRRPNVKGLGLEEVGVDIDDKKAIKVDEYSRTSVDNIWAVGDVTDRINLTPVALMEGMAFAKTAFHGEPTKPDHTNVPSAVFTNPPIGTVGLTEAEAVEKYGDVDVYTSTFRPMKSTISGNPVRTFVKILVDAATDKVVGLHMCGEDGPEIMQGFAVAVRIGVTKKDIDSTVGIHPTSAEELVTMRTATRQVRKKDSQNGKGEKELAAAAT